jgi:serine/threonine protein kinase
MGRVYVAQHLPQNGRVVVKFLSEELRGDEASVARFEREARELSRLRHPNIVTFLGHGQDQGRLYLVMEHVQGVTLRQLLEKRGALGFKEFLPLALQILDGVGAIHTLNIIHRDLKPQNLMVCPRVGYAPLVKILDFGRARSTHATNVITKRELFGSVLFLSPEQITGHKLNARTDVYALGVLFYMMLTGRYPIQGDSDFSTLTRHLRQRPTPLAEAAPDGHTLPRALCDLVDQCLSKNPRQRPANANLLLECFLDQVVPEGEAFARYVAGQRTLPTMSEALAQPQSTDAPSFASGELDFYEGSPKPREEDDSLDALLEQETRMVAGSANAQLSDRETLLMMDPLVLGKPSAPQERPRVLGARRSSTGEMPQLREGEELPKEAAWVAAAVPMGAVGRASSWDVGRSWVAWAVALLIAIGGVGGALGWTQGWFDGLRPSVVERRDLETLLDQGEVLVAQGRLGEMERLLVSLDERASQHPDLLVRLGRIRERALTEGMLSEARDREVQGDLQGASALYEQLLHRNPNHMLATEELKRLKAAMSHAAERAPEKPSEASAEPALWFLGPLRPPSERELLPPAGEGPPSHALDQAEEEFAEPQRLRRTGRRRAKAGAASGDLMDI